MRIEAQSGPFTGMVKIETRLLSFAPGKMEKMETTQTSDGGRYNFGSDYEEQSKCQCRSEDNTFIFDMVIPGEPRTS